MKALFHKLSGIAAAGALLAMVGTPILRAQHVEDCKDISTLMVQAKTHAAQAADDAAQLKSFAYSTASWDSFGYKLNQMKEHFNALGQVQKEMADLRSQGSPWQQVAIDRLDPLLRDMADQLTATIKQLNAHPSRVHMPEYQEYVQANNDYATRTAELIRDYVEYDRAKATVERLEAKLELPAHDSN
jgi:hypothetical protein